LLEEERLREEEEELRRCKEREELEGIRMKRETI